MSKSPISEVLEAFYLTWFQKKVARPSFRQLVLEAFYLTWFQKKTELADMLKIKLCFRKFVFWSSLFDNVLKVPRA